MKIYPLNRYVPHTYKRECDICGFDYLRNEMRKNWKGQVVCEQDYEPKPEREQLKPKKPFPPFRRD